MDWFRRVVLIVCTWCATHGCGEPTNGALGIEDEAYDILNQIIEDNSEFYTTICVKPLAPVEIEGSDWSSEFSVEDKAFIKQSLDTLKNRHFTPGKLVQWHFREHDWGPIPLAQETDTICYNEISWPIFDRKREKALIHIVNCANIGGLSGSGRKVLYVKVRGRWKYWKSYDHWIS